MKQVTIMSGNATNRISSRGEIKNKCALITTNSNIDIVNENKQLLYFVLNLDSNISEIGDVIFLEGDWTDKEISFDHFTGMCSVSNGENPLQVKSINENLFNMDDLESENTEKITFNVTGNTVNVTKLNTGGFVGVYIPTIVGETYNVSFKPSELQKEWVYIYSDKPWGNQIGSLNFEYNNKSFVATSTKTYIGLYAGLSVNVNETLQFSDIVVKKQNSGVKNTNYVKNKTAIESIFYYDNDDI